MFARIKAFFNTKTKITAVAAGILLAAAIGIGFCLRTNRAERAAAEVINIAADVHKLFAHKASYWTLNNDSLRSNDILTNYAYKNNQLVNALGKPVLIGKGEDGTVVMPGEKSFDVVYTDLSAKECVNVAAYRYQQQEMLGLLQITIIGAEKSRIFEWGAETYKLPVTRPEAEHFCSDKSKVIWTFE